MVYFMGSFNNKVDYQFLKNTGTDDLLKTKKKTSIKHLLRIKQIYIYKVFFLKKRKKV